MDLDLALATSTRPWTASTHVLEVSPTVFNSVADAAPDLLSTVSATRISDTVVDQQDSLNALLLSAISGRRHRHQVLSENCASRSTDVVHLLVPHRPDQPVQPGADVRSRRPAAAGQRAGTPMPGTTLLRGFFLGRERYRYPGNLPKVAAKRLQCTCPMSATRATAAIRGHRYREPTRRN